MRVWKQNTATGVKTYFLYESGVPICELDASGNVSATNTWGPDGLVSRRTGSSSVFYSFDERGNTVQRTDATGNVLSSRMTDAFGTPGGSVATGDPYDGFGGRFGYYTDSETGLQLCTYRYYDPATGRWINRDPIGYVGGLNLYAYCTNNPITLSDWTGLSESIAGGGKGCPTPGDHRVKKPKNKRLIDNSKEKKRDKERLKDQEAAKERDGALDKRHDTHEQQLKEISEKLEEVATTTTTVITTVKTVTTALETANNTKNLLIGAGIGLVVGVSGTLIGGYIQKKNPGINPGVPEPSPSPIISPSPIVSPSPTPITGPMPGIGDGYFDPNNPFTW